MMRYRLHTLAVVMTPDGRPEAVLATQDTSYRTRDAALADAAELLRDGIGEAAAAFVLLQRERQIETIGSPSERIQIPQFLQAVGDGR